MPCTPIMISSKAPLAQRQAFARPVSATCRPQYQTKFRPRPNMMCPPPRFAENSLLDLMPLFMPSSAGMQRYQSARPLRTIITDVVERQDRYEIICELPGVSKDDIKVDHSGDVLNISVAMKEEKQDEEKSESGVTIHRMERSASFAKRSMRMPDAADFDSISAKLENGILTVTVAKKENVSKAINIEVA